MNSITPKVSICRYTLFIILCLSAMSEVESQTYTSAIISENVVITNTMYKNPICNWNDKYTVAFLTDGPKPYFCLVEHGEFTSPNITIPPAAPACSIYYAPVVLPANVFRFYVWDIYVADKYAFFSGTIYNTDTAEWRGILGYLDLDEFFLGTINVHYTMLSAGTTAPPSILSRLVAYKHGSSYKVVAFGVAGPDYYNSGSKIVEIDDAMLPSSSCDVADMFFVPSDSVSTIRKLFIDDILLTKNYVVFTEHDLNVISYYGYAYPWFSFGKKNSVVGSLCSNGYDYVIPNVWEANDATAGVAIGGDTFAMSYVYYDDVADKYYTRLRTIDIHTCTNIISQQFEKPEKENPLRMIYYDNMKAIELLQAVNDSADFILLYPYATVPYSTKVLVPGGSEFTTLTPLSSNGCVSSQGNRFYFQKRSAPVPYSTPDCPSYYNINVDDIGKILPFNMPQATMDDNHLPAYSTLTLNVFNNAMDNNCHSFE